MINIVAGAFAIGYVPAALVVPGDAAATAHNILAHEPLYRLGLAAHLVPYIQAPSGLAELSLCLWLLVMGVNDSRWQEQASTADSPPRRELFTATPSAPPPNAAPAPLAPPGRPAP